MNVLELFAGIGGIGLGLERVGAHVVGACEIDGAARGVYADHWPDVPLYPDVTELDRDDLRTARVDLIAAGFPCQDLSVAGRRAGLDGTRSGLFWEIVRLAAATRPRWLLLENVPGLLSSNDGRDMGIVLGALGDLGYGWAYRVLDAQHFGVPQRRRRVFIVGCLGDRAAPVQVLLEPEGGPRDSASGREAGSRVAATLTSGSHSSRQPGRRSEDDVNLVATNLTSRQAKGPDSDATDTLIVSALTANGLGGGGPDDNNAQGGHLIVADILRSHPRPGSNSNGQIVTHALTSEGADASEDGTGRGTPLVAFSHTQGIDPQASTDAFPTLRAEGGGHSALTATAVRRLTPTECERLQGFPDGWTSTSNGKAQSDSARYRQLGNAVAVPVVEWIAHRLAAADGERVA